MHTAAYKVDVASDRRRRENVPRHILCYAVARNSQSVFLVVVSSIRKKLPADLA